MEIYTFISKHIHTLPRAQIYELMFWKCPLDLWQVPLKWRHNERDGISNHQPHDCLLNRLFRRRSKKISKLRVTGLCEGNSPVTGEFPAQRASNAEIVSIWWRHHVAMTVSRVKVKWTHTGCSGDTWIPCSRRLRNIRKISNQTRIWPPAMSKHPSKHSPLAWWNYLEYTKICLYFPSFLIFAMS